MAAQAPPPQRFTRQYVGTLSCNVFTKKKCKQLSKALTSDLSFTIMSERKVTLLCTEVIMANDTKERYRKLRWKCCHKTVMQIQTSVNRAHRLDL